MGTNELMLGDWVLDTRTKNPLRVNPFMAEMEVPEWEPIPLTQEILENNGFEYIKRKVFYPNYSSDNEVELEYMYCKGLRCSFDIIHSYLMFNSNIDLCNIRMIVNYVHELQHLLKLCRIDKEIEL
jgi:hypothetical protein